MIRDDFKRFVTALTGCAELYNRELSEAALAMWWKLLERYDIEQVERALHACASNADNGQFMPKPADLIRELNGTTTDRSMIAWGYVLGAMSAVGAYQSVAFDDAAIHAAVEDAGGWAKLCRTESKELGYVQHRFCASHKAYTTKGDFDYPRVLGGDRDSDAKYIASGLKPPAVILVGDEQKAIGVMRGGSASGKGAITFNSHLLKIASNAPQIARTA